MGQSNEVLRWLVGDQQLAASATIGEVGGRAEWVGGRYRGGQRGEQVGGDGRFFVFREGGGGVERRCRREGGEEQEGPAAGNVCTSTNHEP